MMYVKYALYVMHRRSQNKAGDKHINQIYLATQARNDTRLVSSARIHGESNQIVRFFPRAILGNKPCISPSSIVYNCDEANG